MLPMLKDGDIVFFKKYINYKSILKKGQIVIFDHPLKEICLIKRIKVIRNNSIEVYGDNIELSEDSNSFGFINNEKVIGIVTSKLLNLKLKNFLSQKNSGTFMHPK